MAASENLWPSWVDSAVSESLNHMSYVIKELVVMIFGAETNTTTPTMSTETLVDKSLFFVNNAIEALSFDNFQLQLLKIFTIILTCIAILIYMAWHVYGLRISERFMNSNKDARANSPSTAK